jgi:hypothetical protein
MKRMQEEDREKLLKRIAELEREVNELRGRVRGLTG